jgi:Outer membrane protein beta-barrel domain
MIINNNKEFELEDFLNEELEYSKMTPSSAVWDRISKEVKPHYRWALWVLTLLMLFVPYSLVMYYLPSKHGSSLAYTNSTNKTTTQFSDNNIPVTRASKASKITLHNNDIAVESSPISNVINNNSREEEKPVSSMTGVGDNRTGSEAIALQTGIRSSLTLSDRVNADLQFIQPKKIANKNTQTNSLPVKAKSATKFSIEVYATPSISYRNLKDDKTRLQYYRDIYRNNPFTDNIAAKNVNTVLNQKAGFGKEIGIGTRYTLNNRWKLKAGLQFNVQQYSTEAYQTTGTANYAFVKNNALDSVSTKALYATDGTNKVELNNTMYQLSIPIGIQWDAIKKKKFSLGIGASIQPTYLIQDDTYVVSTDYKYFSKGSKFSKTWNLNSAVDLSFNYSNKDFIWYFAPQFRYQLGTTYQDIYSIKEHRWDLGLKIGVVKTF